MTGHVTLYKGDKEIGSGKLAHDAKPLSKYDGDMEPCRFPSRPATATERDTVARLVVVDQQAHRIVYDKFFPYWTPAPGERDWLKQRFAKEFTFHVGPYPSCGVFDYAIDCQTLKEALPAAARVLVTVSSFNPDGAPAERVAATAAAAVKELARHDRTLPKDGKLAGTIQSGPMTDGTNYNVAAQIIAKDGTVISTKKETFTRRVMPFENAPQAGMSDLVPTPFTPPAVRGNAVSCVGRVYTHGPAGLLEGLVAAGQKLLAAPATLQVRIGGAKAIALVGNEPRLKARGRGQIDYQQTFTGRGLRMVVDGVFDYDGFYRFSALLAPVAGPVDLSECYLELPLRGPAPRSWNRRWSGCGRMGRSAAVSWMRGKAGFGTPGVFPMPYGSGRTTCRRFAGSETTIAASVSRALRGRHAQRRCPAGRRGRPGR